MEEKIAKDCVVEVCSEEEGFADTWFRGILEEKPTKSGRKKLRVRYLTLLDEDGSSPLIEKIEPRFIRPVPPENEYKGVVLEEGSMVDADHKDGWWTGVVIKKLENDKFLVYYDSPPDIIEFERKQLRAHIRWTGSKWDHPGIQELDKSMFSSGSMVEVSTVIDKLEVAWFPAMIVKEIKVDDGKKFVVKDCNKYLSFNGDAARTNTTVDSCRVRPTPPPFPVEDYTMLDRVEAFRGSVWRQGLVRGVLADKRYMVSLGATEGESVYKHSDLRPCKVWEDGVWLNRPKRNPIEATPLNVIKTKPMRSCSVAKSMTPKRTAKHTRRSHTPLTITPQVKSIESVKPLTPSPAITVTPLKQTQADTQGKTSPKKTLEPMRNKNGLKTNSTQQKMLEEKNSEEKGRKRKRGEIHNSDLKETANESVSPVISSPVITSTQLKHTKAETQGKTFPKKTFQPMRIQNGLENESTQEKGKPEKETPSDGKRNNSMALETRNVQTKEPLLAQGLRNEMADGLLNGYTLDITPQVDSPGKTSNEKTLEPLRNGNESTREKMPEEHNSEDNSRKRKRGELEHNSDLNETVLSSDRTPNVMKSFAAADDERTKAKDATMGLPFVKKSPVWKTYESMEVFKRVPQSPHFSPLFETKEDFREGFALGMMVTFSGVLEKVKDLKTDVPLSQLNSLKDSFTELKKHGFNVTTPLSRINKLLALKDRQVNILKELEGFDKDMTDESSEKRKAEEEFGETERKIVEVKHKILELQRQEAALEKQKDATYEKICQMESHARDLGVELEDVEFEFETILSAPW